MVGLSNELEESKCKVINSAVVHHLMPPENLDKPKQFPAQKVLRPPSPYFSNDLRPTVSYMCRRAY